MTDPKTICALRGWSDPQVTPHHFNLDSSLPRLPCPISLHPLALRHPWLARAAVSSRWDFWSPQMAAPGDLAHCMGREYTSNPPPAMSQSEKEQLPEEPAVTGGRTGVRTQREAAP